jgi:hypothetical protein
MFLETCESITIDFVVLQYEIVELIVTHGFSILHFHRCFLQVRLHKAMAVTEIDAHGARNAIGALRPLADAWPINQL